VLNGAAGFLHALALVAAFDRRVTCVLGEDVSKGFWRRRLAAWLGVICYEGDEAGRQAALAAAREALTRGETVAIFAQAEVSRSEALSPSCLSVARLAMGAEQSRSGALGLHILPLDLFSPAATGQAGDLLIYVGPPVSFHEFLAGGASEASVRSLAAELENRLTDSPFRLQERDVKFFLADLEQVLRVDLAEDWAARPNWKQTTDGFEISRFVVECVEQLNILDPARLIGLRIELEDFREHRRRWSLRQAEVEAASGWLASPAQRTWYWLESILGLPLALYGLINHLVPVAVLSWRGLLRKIGDKDPGQAWLLRALVVLGCYMVQVALCAHWWGRAAAGYYTLTLPLSGAFLWRYHWVLKARTRLLYLALSLPRQAERLRRMRKAFLEELNKVRDAYTEALGPAR
jgi:hypothetical protein